MPIVYIWSPDKNHPYGHAALQTAKYHISFWPDGDLKELLGSKPIHSGVPGCLVFHQELDRSNEGNRLPTGIYKISKVSDEAINLVYEEFLHYNGIDPEDVTLEVGEKLIEKSEKPEVSVSKTKYDAVQAARGHFANPEGIKFYTGTDSCVTFCINVLHLAYPKWESTYFLLFLYDFFTWQYFPLPMGTVPWFESHIKKHWSKNNGLNLLNVFDNSVTRAVRYWAWDRWNNDDSNLQMSGRTVGRFLHVPVDFKSGDPKK